MTTFQVTNEEEGHIATVTLPDDQRDDLLLDVLRGGAEAAAGPSNDAEHDALLAFLEFFGVSIDYEDIG